jgi:uncharacterized protein YndB with AHSA1/START domain
MKMYETTDLIAPIVLPCSAPHAEIDGGSILATVDVAAPPERVWCALTTDEVEQWWGSDDTYHVTQWAADLRLGGRWSLVVRTRDGMTYPAGGTFLKINAPHKLVQTRKYEWNHPTLGWVATIVTYELNAIAAGTRLTVRHDGFAGRKDAAKEHAHGWERFLGWLEAYLRSVI